MKGRLGTIPTHCPRCRSSDMNPSQCSFFNTDQICMKCLEEERKHPEFKRAHEEETRAVLRGDFNYPGIGWPPLPVTP